MAKKDKKNIKEQEAKVNVENETPEEQVQDQVAEEVEEVETEEEEETVEATLEKEIVNLGEELGKEKDKYIRLYSEFDNFRRRTAKEKLELMKTANEKAFSSLLPILDDFERAQENAQKEDIALDALIEGSTLIYNKFKGTLEKAGLTLIEVKAGDDFDTEFQEAITQIPAPSPELKGKVVDVVEKGFKLGDKVIRFSKVVIGA